MMGSGGVEEVTGTVQERAEVHDLVVLVLLNGNNSIFETVIYSL
jgi:hypothetical protein